VRIELYLFLLYLFFVKLTYFEKNRENPINPWYYVYLTPYSLIYLHFKKNIKIFYREKHLYPPYERVKAY